MTAPHCDINLFKKNRFYLDGGIRGGGRERQRRERIKIRYAVNDSIDISQLLVFDRDKQGLSPCNQDDSRLSRMLN